MILFLIFCALVSPFEIAFVNHEPSDSPMGIINFTVDACFILDLIMNCRTGFFNMNEGMWETDGRKIFDKYMRSS